MPETLVGRLAIAPEEVQKGVEVLKNWALNTFLHTADATWFSSRTPADRGRPVIVGPNGVIDQSLIDTSGFISWAAGDHVTYDIATIGWKRVAKFVSAGGSRGEMTLYITPAGGNTSPAALTIRAAHGYAFPSGGLICEHVVAPYHIQQVRITNDASTAFVEIYIDALAGGLPFPMDIRLGRVNGWASVNCSLMTVETAGGGTVECVAAVPAVNVNGTIAVSGDIRAIGDLQGQSVIAASGGVGTGHMFNAIANAGFFGSANYIGATTPLGHVGYISRIENGPSVLALGIGNPFNAQAYVGFYANGNLPTTLDAYISRAATANGNFTLQNWGTGIFQIYQSGAAPITLSTNGLTRITVDAAGAVTFAGDVFAQPGSYGTGYAFAGVANASLFATGNYVGITSVSGSGVLVSYHASGSTSAMNLGIGNTTDHIAQVTLMTEGANPTTPKAYWSRGAGTNGATTLMHRGTGTFLIQANEAAPMNLLTSAVSRLYIEADGDIGIGTTTPRAKLEIVDSPGRMMFVTATAIVAAQTLIADGTGDVTGAAWVTGVFKCSTGNSSIAATLSIGGSLAANANAGTTTYTLTLSAAGAITVARSAGTATDGAFAGTITWI